MFEQLEVALDLNDVPRVKQVLQFMLPGYQPHAEVVDWVHLEKARRAALRPAFRMAGRQGLALTDDHSANHVNDGIVPI
jgi:hypothetical protein